MTIPQYLTEEARTDRNDQFEEEIKMQMLPDSQKQKLGPSQIQWIQEWILSKNFRDHEEGPMVKPGGTAGTGRVTLDGINVINDDGTLGGAGALCK